VLALVCPPIHAGLIEDFTSGVSELIFGGDSQDQMGAIQLSKTDNNGNDKDNGNGNGNGNGNLKHTTRLTNTVLFDKSKITLYLVSDNDTDTIYSLTFNELVSGDSDNLMVVRQR
jgi:hypothetical protein